MKSVQLKVGFIPVFLLMLSVKAFAVSFDPSYLSANYTDTTAVFNISSTTGNWSFSESASWVDSIVANSGTGDAAITVYFQKNTQSSGSRNINITYNDDNGSSSYLFIQDGDNVDPEVTVNTLSTNDNTPAISGTVDDSTVTFSLRVNNVTYSDQSKFSISGSSSPFSWTLSDGTVQTLADGTYDVSVTATDPAGNSDTDGSYNELSIDTRAPDFGNTVTIESDQTGHTEYAVIGDQIIITFSTDETLDGNPAVTIHGNNAAINRSGSEYTATYTMQNSDNDADPLPFTIDASDPAGNSITTITESDINSSVRFDKTKPTLTDVNIASNNEVASLSKVDDVITLSFTVSEGLRSSPTVSIGGQSATVQNVSGNDYTATYTMPTTAVNTNSISFTVNFTDEAGNNGTQVTSTTDGSSVRFDKTAPTLSSVSITSNNSNSGLAKAGDRVTLSFTASEALLASALPTVEIMNTEVTPVKSGLDYTAVYTMQNVDADGTVTFSVDYSDAAGNSGTSVSATTNSSSVIFDNTNPTLTSVAISSDNDSTAFAVVGDIITLSFTSSETLIGNPAVTIAGQNASGLTVVGNNYTASYTMRSADAETNSIPFTVDFTDRAGNGGIQVTASTDQSSVKFDKTLPTLSSVSIRSNNSNSSSRAKKGDIITLTFSSSEVLRSSVSVQIMGSSASVTNDGLNYTATYTTQNTDSDVNPAGFSISFSDVAGNNGTDVSETSDGSSVYYDNTPPTLSSVSMTSSNNDNSVAISGDALTLTFTSSETLLSNPTVLVYGNSAVVSRSGLNYTASYTVQGSDVDTSSVPFSIDFKDAAGNSGTRVSATTDGSRISIDNTLPSLANVSIGSDNSNSASLAKLGDEISLEFTVSEVLASDPSVTILGNNATVSKSGLNYTAVYTTVNTDVETASVTFTIDFTDVAGNIGSQVTATTDGSSVKFDKSPPLTNALSIASSHTNNSYAKVGHTVTVSLTSNEVLSGNPTVTIGGNTAAVSSSGGNSYTASYTMQSSDNEVSVLAFSVDISDAAGNAAAQLTESDVTDGSSVVFDKTKPTLTAVSMGSDNADASFAKAGDVITVNFTAGEGLGSLPSVTIMDSVATVSSQGNNNYTAAYTTDGNEVNANPAAFRITFSDLAGNAGTAVTSTTDGSAVIYDKTAPTLSNISISSNNANSSLAKSGDAVTVSFRASEALGALPTVTIGGNAAVVTDNGSNNFSAVYTMRNTDTQGTVSFSIAYRDSAGNSGASETSTDDGSAVTFDRANPGVSLLTIASNNANTDAAKVGDIVTVSLTSTEALGSDPAVTIGGNAAAVTDEGSNSYTAAYTMQVGDTETIGLAITLVLTDESGNSSGTLTNTSITDGSSVGFDKSLPTLSGVGITSDNANSTALARAGDVVSLSFSASEVLIGDPTVSIGGRAATVTDEGSNSYSAALTMQNTDADAASLGFTIDFTDYSGNAGAQVTAVTDGSSVRYDKTAPTLNSVHIESNNADSTESASGDQIQLLFTSTEALLTNPTVTISGNAAAVTSLGSNNYRATYVMQAGDSETDGIPFSIAFIDAAGNAGTAVTATTDGSSVSFDRSLPTLTTVRISSNNANNDTLAKIGDVISMNLTASEALQAVPTVRIGGNNAAVTDLGSNNYRAAYTMQAGDSDADSVSIRINFEDAAGNSGIEVTETTDGSLVRFDKTAPLLTFVHIESDNDNTALARAGDSLLLTFISNEDLSVPPQVLLAGTAGTVSGSGTQFSASYTVQSTDSDTSGAAIFINYSDLAGNVGLSVIQSSDGSSVEIDNTTPSLTLVHIESNNPDSTRAKVGDQLTLSFRATETLLSAPTVLINGNAAAISQNTLDYEATYTMQAIDSDASNPVTFSIDIIDAAGNPGTRVTASDDGSSIIFDKTPPRLNVARISSDNADPNWAKVGDTVSLVFTVNENLLNPPVVGLANRTPVLSGNYPNYTAEYEMQTADFETDSIEFYVSLTDLSGNTLTLDTTSNGSNVAFDKTAPTVSIAYNDSLVKEGDQYRLILESSEALKSAPGPVIDIVYAVDSTEADAAMVYASHADSSAWIYNARCPSGNDGSVTVQLTATDRAGNAAGTPGQNSGILIVDNTAPAQTAVSVFKGTQNIEYYSSLSRDLSIRIPLVNDQSLLDGSLTLFMRPEGGLSNYRVRQPQLIQTVNTERNITLAADTLQNNLFSKTDVNDGDNILTFIEIRDQVGNLTTTAVSQDTFLLDRIVPVTGTVADGKGADADFSNANDSLGVNWGGFSDDISGIDHYELMFFNETQQFNGTWTEMHTDSSYLLYGGTFNHNIRYIQAIRALDAAGNISDTLLTDGIYFDLNPPSSGFEMEDFYYNEDYSTNLQDSIYGFIDEDGADIEAFGISIQRSSDSLYWHGNGWIADSTSIAIANDNFRSMLIGGSPNQHTYRWTYYFPAEEMDNRVNYSILSSAVDSAGNVQLQPAEHSFEFVINSGPQFARYDSSEDVDEDELYTKTILCRDIDIGSFSDDSLEFVLDVGPAGMTISKSSDTTLSVSWQTTNWTTGDTLFQIIATDSRGDKDTLDIDLTVNPVNDAPEAFSMLQPLSSKPFNPADPDTFRYKWDAALDVDDTTLTYRLHLWELTADSTDTVFTIVDDTDFLLDMQTLDFPHNVWIYGTMSVSDTFYTTQSPDTFRHRITPPNLRTSAVGDSLTAEVVKGVDHELELVLNNSLGYLHADWHFADVPAYVTIDSSGQTVRTQRDTLTMVINSDDLPLHEVCDSLLLVSNSSPPGRDSIMLYLDIYVHSPGEMTLAAIQNMAFPDYFEFIVNDSVAMIDSLRFFLDAFMINSLRIDDYTYVAGKNNILAGDHRLQVVSWSFAGRDTLNRDLSVALGKRGVNWGGSSVDDGLILEGDGAALQADIPILIIDSTAFHPLYKKASASYMIGQPGRKFAGPVMLKMRHEGQAQAIYKVNSEGVAEELPSIVRDGMIMAWTDEMGMLKKGEQTIIVAEQTELGNNYPNPFNPQTRIPFDLGFFDGPQRVQCRIYNIRGQEVYRLTDRHLDVGHYEFVWPGINNSGQSAASGVYFARIITENGFIKTEKMVLIR